MSTMKSLIFLFRLLIVIFSFAWLCETQSQYQQYASQFQNRQFQRNVQTSAFMMTRAHRNTNANFRQYITFENLPNEMQQAPVPTETEKIVQTSAFMMTGGHKQTDKEYSEYIKFDTLQISANAKTFSDFGAFTADIPGLYALSYTIRGNGSSGTEVQLKNMQGTIYSTVMASDTRQMTTNVVALLRKNDTVYLEITSGDLLENSLSNGTYNSFMGILIVPETTNPFLQNVFGNNINPNSFQNVGGFANAFAPNPLGSLFGIPFAT